MMKWKDFLYFSKNDKIAIILLSVLICVCGIFYIYLCNFSFSDPTYIAEEESTRNDFVYFEEQMAYTPSVTDSIESGGDGDTPTRVKKNNNPNNKKLVEGQTIDINTATKQILVRLPNIGITSAERIIEYRKALGGFVSLDQLTEIKGISTNKFSKILPYIVLKKRHNTIRINTISAQQLQLHPYFSNDQIEKVSTLRRTKKITSIEDLKECNEFTARDIDRLSHYLSFD